MPVLRLLAFILVFLPAPLALAQTVERPSTCLAVANALPRATYVSLRTAAGGESVTITYAGHSTYIIETPAGVRIATDFSGLYGTEPRPDIVTMNKAMPGTPPTSSRHRQACGSPPISQACTARSRGPTSSP